VAQWAKAIERHRTAMQQFWVRSTTISCGAAGKTNVYNNLISQEVKNSTKNKRKKRKEKWNTLEGHPNVWVLFDEPDEDVCVLLQQEDDRKVLQLLILITLNNLGCRVI
jgi:hypothetical protein